MDLMLKPLGEIAQCWIVSQSAPCGSADVGPPETHGAVQNRVWRPPLAPFFTPRLEGPRHHSRHSLKPGAA